MHLHDIRSPHPLKRHSRVGRGIAAGQGKTAGRGTKGQGARTGKDLPRRFEGGQTPLIQRLPKLNGFRSLAPKAVAIPFQRLEEHFQDGMTIGLNELKQKKLLRSRPNQRVTVVASQKMTKKFTLTDMRLTAAVQKHLGLESGSVSNK